MPTAHINQWKHNRGFLGLIDPGFPDWAVTVAFYTALHAVDALLAHDKVLGIVNHDGRNRTLMQTNRYAHISKYYHPLYGLSRTVRYMASPERWLQWSLIQSKVIAGYLHPIEESVQKLMGSDLHLSAITMKVQSSPA